MRRVILITVYLLCIFVVTVPAEGTQTYSVPFKGQAQTVHYELILPKGDHLKKVPVLVCVGGLPIIDGRYVHSDPRECTGETWERFAEEYGVAILGVGFLFDQKQWDAKESYQYPKVWSGKALKEILKKLAKENPIDPKNLYLFGISAGAQFSVRYAFFQPKAVKAVAAHAAGGYDEPKTHINTKFLITVGSADNQVISRLDWAKYFVKFARDKDIDVEFAVMDGLGHRQTEEQNILSRQFFGEVLRNQL